MRITFDYANCTSAMVGDHGISADALRSSASAVLAALDGFHQSVDAGKYGFPHLPFDKAVIKAISEYAKDQRGSYDTVCVVGIGGSALGAWALDCGLRGPHPVQP